MISCEVPSLIEWDIRVLFVRLKRITNQGRVYSKQSSCKSSIFHVIHDWLSTTYIETSDRRTNKHQETECDFLHNWSSCRSPEIVHATAISYSNLENKQAKWLLSTRSSTESTTGPFSTISTRVWTIVTQHQLKNIQHFLHLLPCYVFGCTLYLISLCKQLVAFHRYDFIVGRWPRCVHLGPWPYELSFLFN